MQFFMSESFDLISVNHLFVANKYLRKHKRVQGHHGSLLPLFDPPKHDSSETIRRALNLRVNVKVISGDQLAIGKETRRRLGIGTSMYPSSALLGQDKDTTLQPLLPSLLTS